MMTHSPEHYVKHVFDEYDLDIGDATWEIKVTGRLTKRHANIRWARGSNHFTIKISRQAKNNFGWDHMKEVIRHEIAHMMTYIEHGAHSESDFRFQEKLQELDAPEGADKPASEPKYIIECDDCGNQYPRHKKSKVVKEYDRYTCGKCDGSLSRIK